MRGIKDAGERTRIKLAFPLLFVSKELLVQYVCIWKHLKYRLEKIEVEYEIRW